MGQKKSQPIVVEKNPVVVKGWPTVQRHNNEHLPLGSLGNMDVALSSKLEQTAVNLVVSGTGLPADVANSIVEFTYDFIDVKYFRPFPNATANTSKQPASKAAPVRLFQMFLPNGQTWWCDLYFCHIDEGTGTIVGEPF
jgi:hypothetical protein